jgi:anti-sigma factor RsiW
MVTGTHPEDFDLFDYVEGELPNSRRAEIESHLASCARCAEQVALVQAGRDVLRQSQPLELSPRRRGAIVRNLPAQPKERRGWGISPRHVLAALTPVAVVAAVILVLVNVDGNTSEEGAGGFGAGATAEVSSAPTDTSGGGDAQEDGATKSGRLLFAVGPTDAVAAELRKKGFVATAVGDHVEVRNATRADVRKALRDRRRGSVRVVIVP